MHLQKLLRLFGCFLFLATPVFCRVNGYCVFGTTTDCYFHCYCEDGLCDNVTGECLNGQCSRGHEGPGCIFGKLDQSIQPTQDITNVGGESSGKLLLTESRAGSQHCWEMYVVPVVVWSIQLFFRPVNPSVSPSHPGNITVSVDDHVKIFNDSSPFEYNISYTGFKYTEIRHSLHICIGSDPGNNLKLSDVILEGHKSVDIVDMKCMNKDTYQYSRNGELSHISPNERNGHSLRLCSLCDNSYPPDCKQPCPYGYYGLNCVIKEQTQIWLQMVVVFLFGLVLATLAFMFYTQRKRLKACCDKILSCFHRKSGSSGYADIHHTPQNVRRSTVKGEHPETDPLFGQVPFEYPSDCENDPEYCSVNVNEALRIPVVLLSTDHIHRIRNAGNIANLPYSYAQSIDVIPSRFRYMNMETRSIDNTTRRNHIVTRPGYRSPVYANSDILSSQYLTTNASANPIRQHPGARQLFVSADNLNRKVRDNQDYPFPFLRGRELTVGNLDSFHI